MADLEKLMGRLEFCQWLVPAGRQHTFFILEALQKARKSGDFFVELSEDAKAEHAWWSRDDVICPGRPFSDFGVSTYVTWDVQGSSDATPDRWGYRIFSTKFSSFMRTLGGKVVPINRLLNSLQKPLLNLDGDQPSIAYSELYALFRAIMAAPNGTKIYLRCDNSSVVAGVQKGRFRSPSMNALLGLIFDELLLGDKQLQTVWVSTETMVRLGSDGVSRNQFGAEGYTVARCMLNKIQRVCTEAFGLMDSKIMRKLQMISVFFSNF